MAEEIRVYSNSPQRSRPPLVTFFAAPDFHVVLIGRLYYRRNWLDRLRVPPNSDAELIGFIYRQLGTEGLRALEGEFALVVVDRLARQVLAMRCPMEHTRSIGLHERRN